MNKRTGLFFLFFCLCFFTQGCHKLPSTVKLPNNYYLKNYHGEVVYLYNKKGEQMTEYQIDMFAIKGNYVYGFLRMPSFPGYFYLDTETGEFAATAVREKLDEWTESNKLHSFTGYIATYFRELQKQQSRSSKSFNTY